MSTLRIVYIVSLVILGVLIAVTVFQPVVTGGKYSEVQRAQLLEIEDQWIIKFNIINQEGRDTNYTIRAVVDGRLYNQPVLIKDGGVFIAVHHIYRDRLTEGKVGFAVYKEGEETPFEQVTYHLK